MSISDHGMTLVVHSEYRTKILALWANEACRESDGHSYMNDFIKNARF